MNIYDKLSLNTMQWNIYTKEWQTNHKSKFDLSLLTLKVSKSQNQFFLKLHCPKNERNIWQNSTLASYCPIFCSFFGQWGFKKNWFWDLLTFIIQVTYTYLFFLVFFQIWYLWWFSYMVNLSNGVPVTSGMEEF